MAFVTQPPNPQTLTLKIKGLFTNSNPLSEAPDGALATCDNIWLSKDSIAECRRGFAFLTYALPHAADRADKLGQFQNTLLIHFNDTGTTNNNDTLAYYNNSTGVQLYTGIFAHPDPLMARMKFAESNQNIYFTTAAGVYKNDLITNTPVLAGMYPGLDVSAALSSDASGFLSNNAQVAYRIVWGIQDANQNLILGAPSQRATVSNQSGVLSDASVTFTIPSGVTVNHFYQIYRSDQAQAISINASLVLGDITYTAVTAGTTGNSITVAYTTGGTAGSEVVSVSSSAISIKIAASEYYLFTVSSANATAAATYTNNSYTFTVVATIASGTALICTGAGTPTASGTLTKASGTGDSTITFSAFSIAPASTAAQVLAALNGSSAATAIAAATITGISTNPQAAPTSGTLSGGSITLVTPNDNMQLVYEGNPTSGQISAASVTVIDSVPDSLRGAALYTNSTQQGILQANNQPPYCLDMALFQTCMFFANTQTAQQLFLTLLAAGGSGGVVTGETISIAGVTYTGADGTGAQAYLFAVSSANATVGATYTNNGQTFTVVTTISSGTSLLCTSTGAPGTSGTLTKASGTGDATITFSSWGVEIPSQNQYQIFTGGSPAQNINNTALSLVRVINQCPNTTLVYAYYLSSSSTLPGQMLIQARNLGGLPFAITASARGTAWSPTLPTSGTSVSSTNTANLNGLMYSKTGQPESVPSLNILYVGSASKPIRRIVPVRNSLFILKDDGVFRCTGTAGNFAIDTIDTTVIILAPESAVALNNNCYALTTQGVVAINDNGAQVVSRPIENQLLSLEGANISAFQQISFGCSYESERQYCLWTISGSGDTFATQCFIWNTFTKTWTRSTRQQTHALVLTADNKMYCANPSSNGISQERKSYTFTDYTDEAYTVTIDAVSTDNFTLTLADASNVVPGDMIYTSQAVSAIVSAVNYATGACTMATAVSGWADGASSVLKSIPCLMEWLPIAAGNPGYLRQFSECALIFKQNGFATANLNFYSEISSGIDSVPFSGSASGAWGTFAWGTGNAWGGTLYQRIYRTYVPREKQRCDLLSVQFQVQSAQSVFQIEGLSTVLHTIGPRMTN